MQKWHSLPKQTNTHILIRGTQIQTEMQTMKNIQIRYYNRETHKELDNGTGTQNKEGNRERRVRERNIK
jgi:hypothetical protein